jgi:hypothetical protein
MVFSLSESRRMGVAPRSLFHESATSEPAAGCYEIQLTGEEAPKRKLEVALGRP